jgi:hypothetical protein
VVLPQFVKRHLPTSSGKFSATIAEYRENAKWAARMECCSMAVAAEWGRAIGLPLATLDAALAAAACAEKVSPLGQSNPYTEKYLACG